MKNNNIKISDLYAVKKNEMDKMYATLLSAFQEYPKLLNAFPQKDRRLIALEMTIRFYGNYDFHYGKAYSLDDNINEVVVLVHSNKMKYSLPRYFLSGCYNKEHQRLKKNLTKNEHKRLSALFDELDALEATLHIPKPHIYIDFLGTKKECQGNGRGRRLMNKVCSLSDDIGLPIMLFTNTAYDVRFYKSLGFHVIGVVSSNNYGFTNTYMVYEPKGL